MRKMAIDGILGYAIFRQSRNVLKCFKFVFINQTIALVSTQKAALRQFFTAKAWKKSAKQLGPLDGVATRIMLTWV